MTSTTKAIFLWIGALLVLLIVYVGFQRASMSPSKEFDFTRFVQEVEGGSVREVTIADSYYVTGFLTTGERFRTYIPMEYPELLDILRRQRVIVRGESGRPSGWMTALIGWLPFLLLIGFWVFYMRQMPGAGNRATSFGKSRARLLMPNQKKVTFKDVAGVEEAREELREVIEFLKEPQKFQKLGGRIPKGVLLVGPPGTGKTLLARAIAGEANVPFFSISGSDFVEMFVGVGASRVRDLFEQGKKNAPCIIFMDEIDAVGRHRGAGLGGGHDEREQTLNQLLVEMDGFESNEGVVLVAATNRPDVLDPALLRPGRFDRRVVVPRPDVKGREGILAIHARKIPLGADVDIAIAARSTPGFSGADLANLVNEAALNAARMNQKVVSMEDFEAAKDKVLMGAARKSLIISDHEKRVTAYHEAGHALVAAMTPGADPLHKVTIIPRGMALGVTQQLPVDDRHTYPLSYLEGQLTIMMGGRQAEELCLDTMTTGAGNDIEQATELARKMVCQFGMSPLGPLTFGSQEELIFLGREISQHRDYSEATARAIDKQVHAFVMRACERAKQILTENKDALVRIAEALLKNESLDAAAIKMLIAGQPLGERRSPDAEPPAAERAPARADDGPDPMPALPHGKPVPA
ncbi:MAG: ATP-dependent metallopeptidase FtsH/Yme1/Tma family protein [Deltaproteobacteria bacterium]|nr:ATP-dependent metallopeptidase FtsH/Yme1/Tma family protein [Deltaproteobacteria bacterium]